MGMTIRQRSKRQSFLGENSDQVLDSLSVAVIGGGGGGSHVAQQLAHVGFGNVHLIDHDFAEEHHRHRLIGISRAAVKHGWHKVSVLQRLMCRIHPEGRVIVHPKRWQEVHEVLRTCDLVFTCVDGYLAREEIERYLRRYQVPMIDIGMDVAKVSNGNQIRGQIILSMPGCYCMRCFGFIRDDLLKEEAARYGDAGEFPQVVWSNGVLASTAVGIATSLFLPWQAQQNPCPYLIYDGNTSTVIPSPRLLYLSGTTCRHFDGMAVPGDLAVAARPRVAA
jgi:tRNA A37 threonylcarbamoyladenosine dehydratase